MKIYEILEISNLYNSIKNRKLPLKVSYKFAILIKKISEEMEFYQTKMQEIINEYAKKDESGNFIYADDKTSIVILEGKEKECNDRLLELRNLEVKTPDVTFSLEELEPLSLSIEETICLFPLIQE